MRSWAVSFLAVSLLLSPAAAASVVATLLEARVELVLLGRELRQHLEGRRPAVLDGVEARLKGVETGLDAGAIAPNDAALLRVETVRLRGLLKQARSRHSVIAAPAGMRAVALPPDVRARLSARLDGAAAARSADGRVFDNSRIASGSALVVPAVALRVATRSDLRLSVPSPVPAGAASAAPAAAAGIAGDDAVSALLRERDPEARAVRAREIARRVLAALGRADKDGALAGALADFLRDAPDYRPEGAVSVRLGSDAAGRFSLIFERADGGRRVISGQFLAGTERGSRPPRMAFIVMGAVDVSAAGAPRQDHPGYWREYAGGGRRLEWSAVHKTEKKGWGPWKHDSASSTTLLTAQVWREGRWRDDSSEEIKTVDGAQGKSWLGRAADKVMAIPVVGPTITFCDDVGTSLYTGIVAAPQVAISALGGSDTYSLEAGGSYAKNPLMKKLIGDQGYLDRLTPGARRELQQRTVQARRQALDAGLFPLAPDLRRRVLEAPVSPREAVETLRTDYGAGTYGKRLIHEASYSRGAQAAILTSAGVLTGAFESIAEAVFNPILWTTMGAGSAVTAVQGTHAAAVGAVGAKAAVAALRAVHATATAVWWMPWALTASDNVGKMVQLTVGSDFDKHYFKKLADAGADALYLFVLP